MKKFIYMIALVLFASLAIGQNADLRVKGLKASVDYTLDVAKGDYFLFKYPTDILTDSDSLYSIIVGVDNSLDNLKAYLKVNCDKLTGTPKSTLSLSGKTFWDEATWTSIATKAWSTGAADTVINLTSGTAVPYRFYKIAFVGIDGTYTFNPKVIQFKIAK